MRWRKTLLIVFLVCLGILVLLIAIRQVTMVLVTNSLHKVAETEHFVYYATDEDEVMYSPGYLSMRELIWEKKCVTD